MQIDQKSGDILLRLLAQEGLALVKGQADRDELERVKDLMRAVAAEAFGASCIPVRVDPEPWKKRR